MLDPHPKQTMMYPWYMWQRSMACTVLQRCGLSGHNIYGACMC